MFIAKRIRFTAKQVFTFTAIVLLGMACGNGNKPPVDLDGQLGPQNNTKTGQEWGGGANLQRGLDSLRQENSSEHQEIFKKQDEGNSLAHGISDSLENALEQIHILQGKIDKLRRVSNPDPNIPRLSKKIDSLRTVIEKWRGEKTENPVGYYPIDIRYDNRTFVFFDSNNFGTFSILTPKGDCGLSFINLFLSLIRSESCTDSFVIKYTPIETSQVSQLDTNKYFFELKYLNDEASTELINLGPITGSLALNQKHLFFMNKDSSWSLKFKYKKSNEEFESSLLLKVTSSTNPKFISRFSHHPIRHQLRIWWLPTLRDWMLILVGILSDAGLKFILWVWQKMLQLIRKFRTKKMRT